MLKNPDLLRGCEMIRDFQCKNKIFLSTMRCQHMRTLSWFNHTVMCLKVRWCLETSTKKY